MIKPLSNQIMPVVLLSVGLTLLVVVTLLFVLNGRAQRSFRPIKLVTGEWAPYTGQSLPEYGIATAIVTQVLRDNGYQPEYEFMPWKRGLELAALGEKDNEIRGTFPYIDARDNPEEEDFRSSHFYFSESILSIPYTAFYHREKNPAAADITTPADLSDHRVMLLEGYEYPKALKDHFDSVNSIDKKTNYQAFQDLAKEDGPYVVLEAAEVGEQLLQERLPALAGQIGMAPMRVELKVKLLFSKRNPNNLSLRRDFDARLNSLKANPSAYSAFEADIRNRIEISNAVALEPTGDAHQLIAYADPDKQQAILLPKGSLCVIKQWDRRYLGFNDSPLEGSDSLVKIKLLNGPAALTGKLMYIEANTVRISPGIYSGARQ